MLQGVHVLLGLARQVRHQLSLIMHQTLPPRTHARMQTG